MNKTELARKIQTLEGLSNEEKTALLELIRGHKKYGLVWEEKPEDIEERLREELPILVERNDSKVHPIISDNPAAPNHLIIEGDNLAALTELSYTHNGNIESTSIRRITLEAKNARVVSSITMILSIQTMNTSIQNGYASCLNV